jgi:hypothetical protein
MAAILAVNLLASTAVLRLAIFGLRGADATLIASTTAVSAANSVAMAGTVRSSARPAKPA